MTDERTRQGRLLSIGALARAVGVPAETLRTWERRYGFPAAERTSAGHRRYTWETLERLRLVRAAIRAGHPASVALNADEAGLQLLVGGSVSPEAPAEVLTQPVAEAAETAIDHWVELVARFDGRGLDRELGAGLASLGVLAFLERRVGPFVREVGERWSTNELGIRHEHFATERLQEFLARHWRTLSDAAQGPAVVCATPAGERHTLGLQMAALTLALNGMKVEYLGGDLPALEIAKAIVHHGAGAVVLSAACGAEPTLLAQECAELRAALGPEVAIVVGGGGFEQVPAGVLGLGDLSALDEWARGFAREAARQSARQTYS
ncbi:MAG: cobalamin B12-binding domain-containing protein [Polyangiales bacterium]